MRWLKSTSGGLGAVKVKLARFSNCCTSLSNFSGCYVLSQRAHSQEAKWVVKHESSTQHLQSTFGEGPSAERRHAAHPRIRQGWYATIGTATTVWPAPHWQIEFTVAYRWQTWSNKHQSERRRGSDGNKNHYTDEIRNAFHLRVRGSAGRMGNTCSHQPLQLEHCSILREALQIWMCIYIYVCRFKKWAWLRRLAKSQVISPRKETHGRNDRVREKYAAL